MRLAKPAGLRGIILTALSIAVLVIAGYVVYTRYIHKSDDLEGNQAISDQTIVDTQSVAASKSASSKDYKRAADSYIAAASAATAQGNYKQAEDILLDAKKQIPYNKSPYYLYESLALAAKQQKDITNEKDAYGKAYALAIIPGSGASPAVITIYKQELQRLGVKV